MNGHVNTHITHIEDDILISGMRGAEAAIEVLQDICDLRFSNLNISLKWDGAPAIIVGKDPRDDNFFVATKSVFSKKPIMYKSIDSIMSSVKSSELKEKLRTTFRKLSKLDIKDIVQGDLLYTEDVSVELIQGIPHYIFQPNTIAYAIKCDTEVGRLISKSSAGIAWHTSYEGSYIRTLRTVKFKPPSINTTDIYIPEMFELDKIDIKNKDKINNALDGARNAIGSIPIYRLKAFVDQQRDIKSICYKSTFQAYINHNIASKPDYIISTSGYGQWLNKIAKTRCASLKSSAARIKCNALHIALEKSARSETFRSIVKYILHLTASKELIINSLNKNTSNISLQPYKRIGPSLKPTSHEGFVVHDELRKKTYKLINRSEFSNLNFNNVKSWDHDSTKKIVIVYGRFNPPTIGHKKLIDCAANLASNCEFRIYISHSCDSKRNPLPSNLKHTYMKHMFKQHAKDIYICSKKMPTIIDILTSLYNEGYRVITLVVGSDRFDDMSALVHKFNGKYSDHGYYNFASLHVSICGMRDEKAQGLEGMSASKARDCVIKQDYEAFKECMPKRFTHAEDLYKDLRKYLR